MLLNARMAKAAGSSFGIVQYFHFGPLYPTMAGYYHLADPFSIVDDKFLIRQVDQYNPDLSAIIGIDRSRSIQYRNTLFQGQPATRPDLGFKTGR